MFSSCSVPTKSTPTTSRVHLKTTTFPHSFWPTWPLQPGVNLCPKPTTCWHLPGGSKLQHGYPVDDGIPFALLWVTALQDHVHNLTDPSGARLGEGGHHNIFRAALEIVHPLPVRGKGADHGDAVHHAPGLTQVSVHRGHPDGDREDSWEAAAWGSSLGPPCPPGLWVPVRMRSWGVAASRTGSGAPRLSWVEQSPSTTPLLPSQPLGREVWRKGLETSCSSLIHGGFGCYVHPCRAQIPCLIIPGAESRRSLSSPAHLVS